LVAATDIVKIKGVLPVFIYVTSPGICWLDEVGFPPVSDQLYVIALVPLQLENVAVGDIMAPAQIGEGGFNARFVTEGGAFTVTL
jgi:hypothetical protein